MITYTYTLPPELADLELRPGMVLELPQPWPGLAPQRLIVSTVRPDTRPAYVGQYWVYGTADCGQMKVRVIFP